MGFNTFYEETKSNLIKKVDEIFGESTLRGSYFVAEVKLCFRKMEGNNIKEIFIFINPYSCESKMGGATSTDLQDAILKIVSNKEIAPSTGWYGDPFCSKISR